MTVDGRVVKRGDKKEKLPLSSGWNVYKDKEKDIFPEDDDDIP